MHTRTDSQPTPTLGASEAFSVPLHLRRYADEVEQWRREALATRSLRVWR